MRWETQHATRWDDDALPGLESRAPLARTVTTPDFAGVTFHEVHARSVLNHVPGRPAMPFDWTVNPYRGCTHACVYCFARPTHEYLGLDGGRDFDTQIIVKVNAGEVLRRELSAPSWSRATVALGTNTDPYQRPEGRYRLMPGIIAALTDAHTPFSILTKGTLLRRDLPLLADAGRHVTVDIAMSIAVLDESLRTTLEPGAPSFAARVATIRAAADAGLRPRVFLMPVLPHLTDSVEVLDETLGALAAAGCRSVVYGALHLKPGVREWFWLWLERTRPDLLAAYRGIYPGQAVTASPSYRAWLDRRIRPLIRRHKLGGHSEGDADSRPRRPSPRPIPEEPALF